MTQKGYIMLRGGYNVNYSKTDFHRRVERTTAHEDDTGRDRGAVQRNLRTADLLQNGTSRGR